MHPIWRVSIGAVMIVREYLQPRCGFGVPAMKYRDYNDPHIYLYINAFVGLIYLASLALMVSGLLRIVLSGRRRSVQA